MKEWTEDSWDYLKRFISIHNDDENFSLICDEL